MPSEPKESIVSVIHECADGWHTFTSKQVPGLFLVGQDADLQEVYEAIPNVIAALARADFGQDVSVTPEKSFSSYVDSLPAAHPASERHYSVRPVAA